MARLPTADELSGPASLRSGRTYGVVDATGAGRGLAAAGDSIAGLGLELKRIDKENLAKQNAVDIARAEAVKTEGLLSAQNQFDNDPDYSTYKDRAPKATGEVVTKAADLIRDPEMRQRWAYGAQADAARVNDGIYDKGTRTRRAAETVAFDDALETNRRIYVDPDTTDEAKAKAKADINGAIKTGQSTGLLSPEEADARRKTYIENADFSRGKLAVERDPSIISRPLPKDKSERVGGAMGFFMSRGWTKEQAAGIVGNLFAESELNPHAVNKGDGSDGSDSIGAGQWNKGRATALKAFAAQQGKDWRDISVQYAFVDHELRNNERSAGDRLRAAKDVRSATEAMIMYERPQGSNNGPHNAHNYSGRLKFAAMAAGQDTNPDWYKAISPEQRAVINQEAETRQNQIGAEMRGQIEVATQNAPIAIQNTGSYDGALPTADQFMQAYGPQEGADRYNKFQASVQTGQDAYSFRTMSAEQIQQVVDAAAPTSSGDDAAVQQQRYSALSNAASGIVKAREADPAIYVRQAFPNVDQAWQGVTEEGGYQRAIAASVAAQQSLGIRNVQPLPADIADNAVAQFKSEQNTQADRIASVSNVLMATPDTAQRGILFNQLVKAGLPEITQGAFEALSRGDQGAANRLFQAAMIDPSKIAGTIPGGIKTSDIDLAVQTNIMDQGQVGDLYYGLTNGTADNYVQAERDSKLINNAVNLRLRNGETLDAAIQGVSKDLYGDVQAVTSHNAQIIVPRGQDAAPVLDGLNAKLPDVHAALTEALTPPKETKASDGSKAILDAATTNYVNQVMAEGFFRNSGSGYVFIDPFTGTAVSDKAGKPVIFQPDVAAERPKRLQQDNAPLTDDMFDQFQKRQGQ